MWLWFQNSDNRWNKTKQHLFQILSLDWSCHDYRCLCSWSRQQVAPLILLAVPLEKRKLPCANQNNVVVSLYRYVSLTKRPVSCLRGIFVKKKFAVDGDVLTFHESPYSTSWANTVSIHPIPTAPTDCYCWAWRTLRWSSTLASTYKCASKMKSRVSPCTRPSPCSSCPTATASLLKFTSSSRNLPAWTHWRARSQSPWMCPAFSWGMRRCWWEAAACPPYWTRLGCSAGQDWRLSWGTSSRRPWRPSPPGTMCWLCWGSRRPVWRPVLR